MFSGDKGRFSDFYLELQRLNNGHIKESFICDIAIKRVDNGLIVYDQNGKEHVYLNTQSQEDLGTLILSLIHKGEENE